MYKDELGSKADELRRCSGTPYSGGHVTSALHYIWSFYIINLALITFLIYFQNKYLWIFFKINISNSFNYFIRLKGYFELY